ncbi:uncharacterized protein si:ch211-250c4.3 isoform X1 [Dicentrarchus labrax]|uniref:uncharacterized protein si:ch211-250c4.3 isoform X1 n=2 Tax=Dicentrarchus labrax TaxID=13489 RepID=UPI0021F6163B|nr:uncharacterized protein si:ch211-250c4.3 isoform X1 [Dicentrarchus labrax]
MSVKRKKARLVIRWQKSFSILAPWRKGKGDRDAVLDSEVVLTKMKLFSNFQESLLIADDTTSTISSSFEQDIKLSEGNSHLDDKSKQPQMESGSDYLSTIFSDSQLTRLYKFESEDSGVELPSGANSPSTPTDSEQSFVVHSRESSCDSCNLNSDPETLTDKLVTYAQSSEIKQAEDLMDNSLSTAVNAQDDVFLHSEQLSSSAVREELHIDEDMDRDECMAPGISPEGDEEMSGQIEENSSVTERNCLEHMRQYGKKLSTEAWDVMTGNDFEPEPWRSATTDSLEEYMDECCRLSEAQQGSSNPLGSGLGYLTHICQLIEKIGQLQETNLRLQKQICSLQKNSRMTKTKEDFFHQHCSCGAASIAFQDAQKRHSRSEFLSPSGTLSDLTTIPEVTRHSFITKRDTSSEGLTPVPLWRRGLNRRSYTEGEVHFLGDSTEGLSNPQRRLSENYTWGRVKDLVRKTKLRNQSRLGLTSTSLKMSCPQLYMPDRGPVEPAGRNRNSMITLGHQSKMDFLWQQ